MPVKLSPRLRQAWDLRREGKSHAEIAQALTVSTGTAHNMLTRARTILGLPPDRPKEMNQKRGPIFEWERHPVRCGRCQLLRPCECLPSIWEVASSRRGEAGGDL